MRLPLFISFIITLTLPFSLSGCGTFGNGSDTFTPFPGQGQYRGIPRTNQGQYVRPAHLEPVPIPRLPIDDQCGFRRYLPLIGRSEGSVYLGALPMRTRVIKPANLEEFNIEGAIGGVEPEFRLVEVREYLPGQNIYEPAITNITEIIRLGPDMADRLTIELDRDNIIHAVRCA